MRFFLLTFAYLLVWLTFFLSLARIAEPQPPWISFAHDNNLYKIRPDGSHLEQMTFGYNEEGSHAWSPDGRWIAFSSYLKGGLEIYKMRPNGRQIHRLTDGSGSSSTPAWSPDGKSLVYESRYRNNWQLYKLAGDEAPIKITEAADGASSPAWSPDGEWIAFVTNPPNDEPLLYLKQAEGNIYRQLPVPPGGTYIPQWHPDSRTLIITINERSIYGTLYQLDISQPEIQGSAFPTPLDGQANLLFPSWSPDGKRLAFIGMRSGTAYLYTIRADGTDLQRVTEIDRNIWYPRWSPIINLKWRFVYGAGSGIGLLLLVVLWSRSRVI